MFASFGQVSKVNTFNLSTQNSKKKKVWNSLKRSMKYLYSHLYNPNRDKQSCNNMLCISSADNNLWCFYFSF